MAVGSSSPRLLALLQYCHKCPTVAPVNKSLGFFFLPLRLCCNLLSFIMSHAWKPRPSEYQVSRLVLKFAFLLSPEKQNKVFTCFLCHRALGAVRPRKKQKFNVVILLVEDFRTKLSPGRTEPCDTRMEALLFLIFAYGAFIGFCSPAHAAELLSQSSAWGPVCLLWADLGWFYRKRK